MTDLKEAARQALDALENEWFWPTPRFAIDAIDALRAALAQQVEPVVGTCDCHRCIKEYDLRYVYRQYPVDLTRMILCPTCGNKRCPKASDHRLDCTSSNEPGQPGSVYTAQAEPVQAEPLTWLLINKTGARPLIYGDAAPPAKQAEPVVEPLTLGVSNRLNAEAMALSAAIANLEKLSPDDNSQ